MGAPSAPLLAILSYAACKVAFSWQPTIRISRRITAPVRLRLCAMSDFATWGAPKPRGIVYYVPPSPCYFFIATVTMSSELRLFCQTLTDLAAETRLALAQWLQKFLSVKATQQNTTRLRY